MLGTSVGLGTRLGWGVNDHFGPVLYSGKGASDKKPPTVHVLHCVLQDSLGDQPLADETFLFKN